MSQHPLETRLLVAWPLEDWQTGTVVAAVSGGADSVALLRALAAIRQDSTGKLVVAHFNHRLRGADSDGDERFVAELAAKLGLSFEVGRAERTQESSSTHSEETTRNERYAFLQAAAERRGARYVAVAHTADDQAETILHRAIRGTGLAGLVGMRRARPLGSAVALIRPLLEFRRADLRTYLKAIGQPFREDKSNADSRFTRNRLRTELLPLLARDYNANVTEALLRLGQLAGEAQGVIDRLVDGLVEKCVVIRQGQIEIDARQLVDQPEYLVREILVRVWRERGWPEQAMGWSEWTALASVVQAETADVAARDFPGNVSAQKTGGRVVLARRLD